MLIGADVSLAGIAVRASLRAKRGFTFAAGLLPAGAAFTRASAARFTTAGGVLASVTVDVLRFDHDPVGLTYKGILIESARTNGAAGSQSFASATWIRRGSASATDNAVVAPDGTMTGATWGGLGAIGVNDIYETAYFDAGRFPVATALVPSIWIKPISATGTLIAHSGIGAGFGLMSIDLALLARDAWTRVSPGHPAVMVTHGFASDASGKNGIVFGAPGGAPISVHAWGYQLEAGVVASSYVPTTTASGSRAADVLTLNWASRGVADGSHVLRYVFDDGTTQDVVTTVAAGIATVPTTLNRAWIRSVARV